MNMPVFTRLDASTMGRARTLPLLVRAQSRYMSSDAPNIDNRVYWQKVVEQFEKHRLSVNDRSLDVDLHKFMDRVGSAEKSVIEFGCGIGRAVPTLHSRGFTNYLGTDICARAVEMAQERLPGVSFMEADILDFRSKQKFDSVIATDVLLYLSPEDQIRALLNVRNSLAPDAPLLVRWAPGNDEIDASKQIKGTDIRGWVFLASKEYVRSLLSITGFKLTDDIVQEEALIDPEANRKPPYLKIFAEKAIIGF